MSWPLPSRTCSVAAGLSCFPFMPPETRVAFYLTIKFYTRKSTHLNCTSQGFNRAAGFQKHFKPDPHPSCRLLVLVGPQSPNFKTTFTITETNISRSPSPSPFSSTHLHPSAARLLSISVDLSVLGISDKYSHSMGPFVTGFFYLGKCFHGPSCWSMLMHMLACLFRAD